MLDVGIVVSLRLLDVGSLGLATCWTFVLRSYFQQLRAFQHPTNRSRSGLELTVGGCTVYL